MRGRNNARAVEPSTVLFSRIPTLGSRGSYETSRQKKTRGTRWLEIKSINQWCDRPRFFHFKIGLRHLLYISRKSRMLHGMILFDYHILYTIEYKLCLLTKTILTCDCIKYLLFLLNTTSSQMCHGMPERGWIRLATMWLVYMGLIKPVSYISNHANTQFIHLWHICHKKLTHCSKVTDRPSVMHCLSPELVAI